jgi:peptidyl-prolyl cis-trans isomerase C
VRTTQGFRISDFRTTTSAILLSLVLVLSLASCSKAPRNEPAPFLAKVGDARITTEDFQKEVARRRTARRPIADKETLLKEMVDEAALLQRARALGVDRDPQLQREIQNLILGRFLDQEMKTRREAVAVTTNEVQAEYEKNRGRYTQPAKVRMALLVQRVDAKASETKRTEARARIEEARRLVLARTNVIESVAGAPGFGALAVQYSDDQASRYRGGDIGWLDATNAAPRWPGKVLKAAIALEPGKISDVIEAEGGFYLAMKTDARPGSVVPLAHVEATLRQSVLVKKHREAELSARQEVIRQVPTEINRAALSAVELPALAMPAKTNRQTEPPTLPSGTPTPSSQ